MTIYAPYFYIIKDTINEKYYAGAKWGKDASPSNFMSENGYKTSSNVIKQMIKFYGLDIFEVVRIKIFESAEDAHNYEKRFLEKIDARNNVKFYNQHNNDFNYNTNKNYTLAKNMETNEIFRIDVKETLFKENPNICGLTKNMKKGKIGDIVSLYDVYDPRWETGEIVSPDKNKSIYFDPKSGKYHFTTNTIARKRNYISFSKDKTTVKDKHGNTMSVRIDDPRYLSGELVGHTKGLLAAKDKNGNNMLVSIDDPRYISGELVGVNSKKIVAKDADGNTYRIDKDDPRYISGELVGVTKGKKFYNNGKINKCFYSEDVIPEGFFLGRLTK
jgi:hypothetical protein